jgi:hypothetical protein
MRKWCFFWDNAVRDSGGRHLHGSQVVAEQPGLTMYWLGYASGSRTDQHIPAASNLYEFSQPFESVKSEQYFKSEVCFVPPSLVAPLSWRDDGIVGQTNILSNPPFHLDHHDAIYLRIGCRLG